MGYVTRDAIFGGMTLPREEVSAFGGRVIVQGLTVNQRDDFEAGCLITERNGKQRVNVLGMRAKLVALCCINQDGSRLFEDADALKIGALPAKDVERVFEAAQRLSGISDRDLEELEKNSASGPPVASSSV